MSAIFARGMRALLRRLSAAKEGNVMLADFDIEVLETVPNTPVPQRLPLVDPAYARIRAIGEVRPGQPLIFVYAAALQTMQQHTASQTDVEVGGLLVGVFATHDNIPFVRVDAALPAPDSDSSAGFLRITANAVLAVAEERERRFPDLRVVGWYHSHPGFGIFLSGTDLGTHHSVFKDGPFVAFVLDPIRHQDGVFGWQGDEVTGPVGYWVMEGHAQGHTQRSVS